MVVFLQKQLIYINDAHPYSHPLPTVCKVLLNGTPNKRCTKCHTNFLPFCSFIVFNRASVVRNRSVFVKNLFAYKIRIYCVRYSTMVQSKCAIMCLFCVWHIHKHTPHSFFLFSFFLLLLLLLITLIACQPACFAILFMISQEKCVHIYAHPTISISVFLLRLHLLAPIPLSLSVEVLFLIKIISLPLW